MSIKERSCGKSKGAFSSERSPSLAKNAPQDSTVLELDELNLCIVFVDQLMHVTPPTLSPAEN